MNSWSTRDGRRSGRTCSPTRKTRALATPPGPTPWSLAMASTVLANSTSWSSMRKPRPPLTSSSWSSSSSSGTRTTAAHTPDAGVQPGPSKAHHCPQPAAEATASFRIVHQRDVHPPHCLHPQPGCPGPLGARQGAPAELSAVGSVPVHGSFSTPRSTSFGERLHVSCHFFPSLRSCENEIKKNRGCSLCICLIAYFSLLLTTFAKKGVVLPFSIACSRGCRRGLTAALWFPSAFPCWLLSLLSRQGLMLFTLSPSTLKKKYGNDIHCLYLSDFLKTSLLHRIVQCHLFCCQYYLFTCGTV